MSNWSDYKHEDSPNAGPKVTGRQRCVIVSAEERVSSKGNPMIEIKVRPSGCRFTVRTFLVKNEHFNRNASAFFDAFPEIGDGNFNFIEWPGAIGAAFFSEDENGYLKVKYFIDAKRAESLPPFEGERPERVTVTSLADPEDDENELPFLDDDEP